MKQIKLRVPDNWADITIRQYQQFMDIMESKKREKTKVKDLILNNMVNRQRDYLIN